MKIDDMKKIIDIIDIKRVFNMIIKEIACTAGNDDLALTPKICVVEDRVYFEIINVNPIIQDTLISIRIQQNHNTVLCDKISQIKLIEFDDYIAVLDKRACELYFFNNYDKEDKDYLKFIAIKSI